MIFLAEEIESIRAGLLTQTIRTRQPGDKANYVQTWASLFGVKEPLITEAWRGNNIMWKVGEKYPLHTKWKEKALGWIRIEAIRTDAEETTWIIDFRKDEADER
jgi:hypothetical protein